MVDTTAVRLTNLVKNYGQVSAIDDVSIQIFEYLYTPTVLALFHANNVLR